VLIAVRGGKERMARNKEKPGRYKNPQVQLEFKKAYFDHDGRYTLWLHVEGTAGLDFCMEYQCADPKGTHEDRKAFRLSFYGEDELYDWCDLHIKRLQELKKMHIEWRVK
jgi:hypothetical protein